MLLMVTGNCTQLPVDLIFYLVLVKFSFYVNVKKGKSEHNCPFIILIMRHSQYDLLIGLVNSEIQYCSSVDIFVNLLF